MYRHQSALALKRKHASDLLFLSRTGRKRIALRLRLQTLPRWNCFIACELQKPGTWKLALPGRAERRVVARFSVSSSKAVRNRLIKQARVQVAICEMWRSKVQVWEAPTALAVHPSGGAQPNWPGLRSFIYYLVGNIGR